MRLVIILLLCFVSSCKNINKSKANINAELGKTESNSLKTIDNTDCFTSLEIKNLTEYFKNVKEKSATNDDEFNFSQEDFSYIQESLLKKGLISSEFSELVTECDSTATYLINYVEEFMDGEETHYSESAIWLVLKREGNNIKITDVGGAG
ncbi:hypothetical protein [uncultured Aquimarina sp.]|uniref:hypothetical protein n=1 Tax=uncultured Aquimarina sp. TaxID=575652 RepID=UPI00262B6B7F|nr:hypothetical protein [uncultured Aquimarina sp.]